MSSHAMADTMRMFMARAVVFQDAVARSAGLHGTDLQLANLLLLQGPATPGELAARAGMTVGGAITGAVDRLERAGLATRARDTVDRRKVVVTADAAALWERVGPSYQRVADRWNAYLDTLDDTQLAFAVELFETAAAVTLEEIETLRPSPGP